MNNVEYFGPEYGRKRSKDCFLVRYLPVRPQQSFKSGGLAGSVSKRSLSGLDISNAAQLDSK